MSKTLTSEQRYLIFYKSLGYKPTLAQHRACLFLARNGKEWQEDFVITDAVELAKELRKSLKAKAQKRTR